LSKTGKQIPLWPDKQNTHGHDEDGNAIRGPLPTGGAVQPSQQKSDWNTTSTEKLKSPSQWSTDTTKQQSSSSSSSGGSYLDTKRLRVMVEELTKKVNEIEQKMESHVMIDSNRYENQMQIIYDKLGPLMDSTLTAAEMLKQKENQKQKPLTGEVRGWNSVPNSAPTKFVAESEHDFPVENTLTDDDDDVNDDNTNNNKGVTEED